ncbi:MAG TPA: hypothetical protein VHP30_10055, partial [Ignavibacteriales bacterium]|nr:hypothetical protein [Ignavibacteriales bacterium]
GKIRIKDNDAPTTVFDESNYAFTIAKLNLTSPNSGLERLQTGKNFPITWTSENIANVRIDYSTDNGATWTLIVDNLNAALLTYNWTGIPAAAVTSQGRIRISDASDGPTYTRSDLSDNPFSIKLLNITTPVAGANLKAGASYNITWSKSSNVSSVKIHYAQDGVAFSQIGGALGLTGTTYSWTVPAAATSTGKIRIIDETDNSILAESGAFNITELALTYPLGGEKLQAGTTKNITWTGLSPAKIEYSTNGTTWNLITSGATGGSYAWAIPSGIAASSSYLIKVSDPLDASFNSVSLPFTINKLSITSPNTGSEIWMAGKSYNITWSAELVGTINIEYAADGVSYSPLASGLNSSLGSWTWNIDQFQAATTTGKIRIVETGAGTSTQDESDAAFKIAKLQLSTPNGGDFYQVGKTYGIVWSSENIANVKLEYTTDDGTSWSTIIASTPSVNPYTYNWTVPAGAVSSQARVRVSDASDATYNRSDLSDNLFTIKLLNITAPVAGANLKAGAVYNITWNKSSNVSTVKIHYAQDGVTFSPIAGAAGLTGTSYS